MAKQTLAEAKKAKNDEFYTQLSDIQNEINAYLEYDPDVFRDKTILLPCDDPEWSNFTKFFAQNFETFGLKKLISTSYAIESKHSQYGSQLSLFETDFERASKQFDAEKSQSRGKIFVLDKDTNADGRINIDDLQWQYLEGDGDFDSDEVRKLRDEADIIVTNPPFSLFRKFINWLEDGNKKYILIANKNCITCKEVFPLFKENKLWVGKTPMSQDLLFEIPESLKENFIAKGKMGSKYRIVEGKLLARSTSIWLTNLEHGRRHQPLDLMSMKDIFKYNKHKEIIGRTCFDQYDNYPAIDIPRTDAIPSDYDGPMGVPISFLDKYCPEQFEILGLTQIGCHDRLPDTRRYNDYKEYLNINDKETGASGGKTNENAVLPGKGTKKTYYKNSEGRIVHSEYKRILIRKK